VSPVVAEKIPLLGPNPETFFSFFVKQQKLSESKNKAWLRSQNAVLSQSQVLPVHKHKQAGVLFRPY